VLPLTESAARSPRAWLWGSALASLLMIVLVVLPSVWPEQFPILAPLHIDTDPENMLDADEPVRVFNDSMRRTFDLHDMVVVGVINRHHPQGVFNARTLADVHALTAFAQQLSWEQPGGVEGVVAIDVIAPSTVDNIEQAGPGAVRFEWLMAQPPANDEEALAVATKARGIPFLDDTLISQDGAALALYLPISSKGISYRVAQRLREKIAEFDDETEYHITGLPVAQDQFGVEMFKQMALSAPAAMLLIFALLWLFFRHLVLIVSPMLVALIAVILTMGLLVASGNTVHIMSSMIPIFIMPIAVLDAVHILSDFFDRYPHTRDRYRTLIDVMEELWRPMLYTSITTAVGFGSLALTPIPPVQVFGVFIAIGVALAWLLTITLVPAWIMLIPESSLQNFGMALAVDGAAEHPSPLARVLHRLGPATRRYARILLLGSAALGVVAWYGISQIRINDNPVKWFEASHEIRVADRELNARFGGTYMAYLALRNVQPLRDKTTLAAAISARFEGIGEPVRSHVSSQMPDLLDHAADGADFVAALQQLVAVAQDAADSDAHWEAWDAAARAIDEELGSEETFKRPEVLQYVEALQQYLLQTGKVGKSNGLPDIVKTVHRELFGGAEEGFRIPASQSAVAQTLITYEGSHRPQDLWHFVTPDFRQTNLWIQLRSGDNVDMSEVVELVDRYIAENPAPVALQHDWFGLTYINVVWQQKMVEGMLGSFLGSFVIVLVLMVMLFRSLWWGLLCMVPLTVTIALIYGVIGLIGKDYDMPVAVLSSLSLGLAVDYSIHFLVRTRELRQRYSDWPATIVAVFGEPARAISRNIIVIGCGFLPLLLAPLVPYQTVGVFISAILITAGAATLLLLPALISIFEKQLFAQTAGESR